MAPNYQAVSLLEGPRLQTSGIWAFEVCSQKGP